MKYGYMDHHHNSGKSAPLLSRDGLYDYIMEFQAFAGINQTGELDSETVKWMNMPRCGVKDKVGKNLFQSNYVVPNNYTSFYIQSLFEGARRKYALYKRFRT